MATTMTVTTTVAAGEWRQHRNRREVERGGYDDGDNNGDGDSGGGVNGDDNDGNDEGSGGVNGDVHLGGWIHLGKVVICYYVLSVIKTINTPVHKILCMIITIVSCFISHIDQSATYITERGFAHLQWRASGQTNDFIAKYYRNKLMGDSPELMTLDSCLYAETSLNLWLGWLFRLQSFQRTRDTP